MSNPPLLLGYIRADVLGSRTALHRVEAQLQACAEREDFCLGTVFVERGRNPGALHALMAEVSREDAWGIVVPDLRHVGVVEQLIFNRHEVGARLAVLVANVSPLADGPGAVQPARQVRRSTSVS
jgi:hypothetical protein